jgi:L-2-hydroxyglutarate oxidase LhgO
MKRYDYLIVGGGVIGLAIALELRKRFPAASVLLIEKEGEVAEHASGRNSGVLHSGFYYSSDSLKAKLTAGGNRRMKEFCRRYGLQINECGKVVVARDGGDLATLDELKARGDRNGVPLRMIDEAELREIDPNIMTFDKALYSPTTASVDPTAFCLRLKSVLLEQGVEMRFNTAFLSVDPDADTVKTDAGDILCGYLINCAGLYADQVAHRCGVGLEYTILPFKGIYLKYLGSQDDVRTNVYPVPNLKNPFLGVHFTKTVHGDVKIGPTATPAFWREQYGLTGRFKLGEFATIGWLEFKLFCLNPFGFRSLAFDEMRKFIRSNLIRDARWMVHSIGSDFEPIRPGIRAQLLDTRTNVLVMDFKLAHTRRSTHVLNAVSPAFTCSFTFAEHVIDEVLANRA